MNDADMRELCFVLLFNKLFNGNPEETIKRTRAVYKQITSEIYEMSTTK